MPTREELYERIKNASKQEVILEEMIRLGFWPREGDSPQDPAEEIRRKGELERQLRSLTTENSRLQNVEALKKAARKQRMEESRRKQQENKERRLREKQQRAEAWRKRKESEILYLGQGVSAGLNEKQSDTAKLTAADLPTASTAEELARAMNITVGELRFLAFHRRTSRVSHYKRFAMRKKTGGLRHISAPMPRLKRAQEWVLFNILEKIEIHAAAHGFRKGRSIVTNAQPHVNADVVVNVDLQDFFPTVTYKRIRGVFRNFGYSEQVATLLALLCSEPEIAEVRIDNQTYYTAQSDRRLPQGAPSSPAITNIICRGLDARIAHAATQLGFTYTRYADDITVSATGEATQHVGRMLRRIEFVVEKEGFQLHPNKTRIQRKGRQQEVTGLVVNERLSVARSVLRRFRATLFHIEKDGPAGKRWGTSPNVLASIAGFANFVAMVEPEKGAELKQRVGEIIGKFGRPAPPPESPAKTQSPTPSEPTNQTPPTETDPENPWWKLW